MSREVYNYKRSAIRIAKDLCYGNKVINNLSQATTIAEICRIMTTARKGMAD